MPAKKSTSSKLFDECGKIKTEKPDTDEFMQYMLHHSDPKAAAEMIADQERLTFMQSDKGRELSELRRQCEEDAPRVKAIKDEIAKKEAHVRGTKKFIKRKEKIVTIAGWASGGGDGDDPTDHSPKPQTKIPLKEWSTRDQVAIFALGFFFTALMVMGSSGIYANLISSGQPVFLENKWIAIALSMLLPAGSFSLKFFGSLLEHDLSKKIYSLFIYGAASLSMFAWAALFASEFTGPTGGMDWESFGESSSGHGGILVWIQITAEMLVGTALFSAAENIDQKYDPDQMCENPDYKSALKALNNDTSTHSPFLEIANKREARKSALEAECESSVNLALAKFNALRGRTIL